MNLLQLSAICNDKHNSFYFLQQRGIVHNTRRCDNNHLMTLSVTVTDRQDRWQCCQGACQQDIPVRKGTPLEGSRLSYRQIVLFIYCWSKELTSIKFCECELEIGKRAVIDWNNYLREVCANTLLINPVVIGGQTQPWRLTRASSLFGRTTGDVFCHSSEFSVVHAVSLAKVLCSLFQIDQRQPCCQLFPTA